MAIEVEGGGGVGKLAGREVRDIARDSQTIADFATFYPSQYNVTGGGLPESLVTMIGTSNLFRVFGVRMLHGDAWPPSLDWTSGQYTVVLEPRAVAAALWQQRSIIGHSVKLDGADYLVTGVLPPGFDYPVGTRLYRAVSGYTTSSARRFTGVARLKPGVTLAQVRSELDGLSTRFANQFPDTNRGLRFVAKPLRDVFVGPIAPYLWLLAAAVMFVMLLACANIANLMLSRALGQRSELAVRTAIGASRARVVRHVVAEALVLAVAGGLGGFALGAWAVRMMTTLVPLQLPSWLEVRMEWPVAAVHRHRRWVGRRRRRRRAAIQASRADVRDALGDGSRRVAGGRAQQLVASRVGRRPGCHGRRRARRRDVDGANRARPDQRQPRVSRRAADHLSHRSAVDPLRRHRTDCALLSPGVDDRRPYEAIRAKDVLTGGTEGYAGFFGIPSDKPRSIRIANTALFTSPQDVDRLAEALEAVSG